MAMKAFEKYYDYQMEAKAATKGQSRGIICLPTGTGKTYLQAGLVAEAIDQFPGFNIYVVNAPRILLSFQLCKEIYQFLLQCGKDARYMFVHSGGTLDEQETEDIRIAENEANDAKISYAKFLHGTSTESIRQAMYLAWSQNLPLVFISTYNSCQRIEAARAELGLPPIKLVVNDEAHYLVQERFFDVLHVLTYEQCFFFTATTVETPSAEGRGMNNKEAYGELLYGLEPRVAMDKGRIVRPRVHYVTTAAKVNDEESLRRATNQIIEEAFYQHEKRLVRDAGARVTVDPALGLKTEPLQPKLLVAMRGIGDIESFVASEQYRNLRAGGVDIFAIASSEAIGNDVNGVKTNRPEFLSTLKRVGNDPTKRVLALHYDILSEGIDVNGFTGVLILRTLSKTKFIQTYGRTARLHPIDRKNITAKLVQPWDWRRQMKPFSYILIPDVATCSNDQKEQLRTLILLMRDYGYDFAEHIIGDQPVHGEGEEEQLPALNEQDPRAKQFLLQLEGLFAEIEEADAAALEPETYQTKSRCTALGLTVGTKVKLSDGPATIVGYEKDRVKLRKESGEPIELTPEALV